MKSFKSINEASRFNYNPTIGAGFLYAVFIAGSVVKIGKAKNPAIRLKSYSKLDVGEVVVSVALQNYDSCEKQLLTSLDPVRLHRGEAFYYDSGLMESILGVFSAGAFDSLNNLRCHAGRCRSEKHDELIAASESIVDTRYGGVIIVRVPLSDDLYKKAKKNAVDADQTFEEWNANAIAAFNQ